MIIQDANQNNCAQVTEDGMLMVCLCEKTCAGHVNLIEFLKLYPVNILVHCKDRDGNVVPVIKE